MTSNKHDPDYIDTRSTHDVIDETAQLLKANLVGNQKRYEQFADLLEKTDENNKSNKALISELNEINRKLETLTTRRNFQPQIFFVLLVLFIVFCDVHYHS